MRAGAVSSLPAARDRFPDEVADSCMLFLFRLPHCLAVTGLRRLTARRTPTPHSGQAVYRPYGVRVWFYGV